MNNLIQQAEEAVPGRVAPRCRHFGPCGGCSLQHLDYPAQVEWRRAMVADVLKKETGGKDLPEIEVFSMEEPWGHRSKMEFTFGQEGGRITLGLHQRGSFQRIVDIEQCEIAHPEVSRLLQAIKEIAAGFEAKSYDPRRHEGFWRYAVVRSSRSTGQLMLVLVTYDGPRPPLEAMAARLPERVPALKSLYWGVSNKVSDVAQPDRLERLFGPELLEDSVGPLRYSFGPSNFIQPNQVLVGKVYETIRARAALTGGQAVYDLYCGIGLISLGLAGDSKVVYGVESEQENVSFAEKNAALNGISNVIFLCGRVEDLLKGRALFRAGPAPDVIVLDPPRVGLHKEVYGPLLEARAPRLLYLSCNPASLARDLKILLERDPAYRVESLQMFDFFPHTVHAEVLATLVRAPAS